MTDTWSRGGRDDSVRTPLQGGEHGEPAGNPGDRRDRHLRLGVGHPSGDPARHRVFDVRAAYDAAAAGWVARFGEENANEQLGGWGAAPGDVGRAFPTPAACLGAAVAAIVAAVDRDAADREATDRP